MLMSSWTQWMERGGIMMWPLLAMSLVGLTFTLERAWFWMRTNSASRTARFRRVAQRLRKGDRQAALKLIETDQSIYGAVVEQILEEGASEAVLAETVELQRARLERFMPTLSTIITAAPMVGILGTVTGIISSFQVLADQANVADPRAISGGIAEALLTTAAGLIVALLVLFPYNAYRAQIDRALGRIEMLVTAAAGKKEPAEKDTSPSGAGRS